MNDRDGNSPTTPFGSPFDDLPGRSASTPTAYAVVEILRAADDALSRFGVVGKVALEENILFLRGEPRATGVALGAWAVEWPRLDEASRRAHIQTLVRDLTQKRRRSAPAPSAKTSFRVPPLGLALGGVLLLVSGFLFFGESGPEKSSRATALRRDAARDPATGLSTSEARALRSCAAVQTRVFQGGHVSVADVDGWVVEISLLREGETQPLTTHPALKEFVSEPGSGSGSHFIWPHEPGLGTIDTSDTRVLVSGASLVESEETPATSATLTFSGTYVDAYFSEENRGRYYHIASALTEALGATHAALYARCRDQKVPALGSWFHGTNEARAAASLLFFMGVLANPPHLAVPFLRGPGEPHTDPGHAFVNIAQSTSRLDRNSLATLVGSEGGMATGRPGGSVTITFPFRDGNRSSRVSRSLARVTSLSQ